MRQYQRNTIFALLIGITVGAFGIHSVGARNASSEYQLPMEQLQKFTQVIDHVKKHYVSDVDDSDLFDDAIRGMLVGLDPHSAYLDEETFNDLKVSTTGEFGGLGIEVTMEDGFIKVVSPIDGTPAERAGVQPGDLIVRLDDTPVKGLSLRESVNLMRGEKGKPIDLTIIREGETAPLNITIVRDIINVKSVKYQILEPQYGYLRITHFQTRTPSNLKKAIKDLKKQTGDTPLKGVVLDLRNNPGGVLDSAVEVSDTFLDNRKIGYDDLIVYTQGRSKDTRMNETARTKDMLAGIPMVILVNEGSASASEIVAGSLQDHNRAIIMGQKTFGKGSVQTVLPLSKESGLKLTTAFYYTPSGRSIQAEGIVPDITVDRIVLAQETEEADISAIREVDLNGHLENAAGVDEDIDSEDGDTQADLLDDDYQLREALNLLKGLNVVMAN